MPIVKTDVDSPLPIELLFEATVGVFLLLHASLEERTVQSISEIWQ